MTLTLVVLALIAADPPADGPRLPSSREVIDGYRKNMEAFGTMKIKWMQEFRRMDDWLALERQAVLDDEAKLEKITDDGGKAEQLRQDIARRRMLLNQNRGSSALYQTFVTDRTGFQSRTITKPFGVEPEEKTWGISDDEPYLPGSSDMTPGITVISHTGKLADGYRYWTSQGNGMYNYGQILMTMPWVATNTPNNFQLPPLSMIDREWGNPTYQGNWIDAIFNVPVDRFKVIGRAKVDGHDTVIVETPAFHINPQYMPANQRPAPQTDRVYLDPSRGWLPLRIERFANSIQNGKSTPTHEFPPNVVVEEIQIEQIPKAGFYPMRGMIRDMVPNPSWKGDPSKAPRMVSDERTWRVVKIVANAPLRENFLLPFPKGTQYHDQRTGESHTAGLERWEGPICPGRFAGELPPAGESSGWSWVLDRFSKGPPARGFDSRGLSTLE